MIPAVQDSEDVQDSEHDAGLSASIYSHQSAVDAAVLPSNKAVLPKNLKHLFCRGPPFGVNILALLDEVCNLLGTLLWHPAMCNTCASPVHAHAHTADQTAT